MGQGSGQAFSTADGAGLHRGPAGAAYDHCDLLGRATVTIFPGRNEASAGLPRAARSLSSRNAHPEVVSMTEPTHSPAVWTILLGPGPRLGAFEPSARGLLSAHNPDIASSLARIDDLAQLLRTTARGGRLLLDADEVPLEDLGLVRRFLAAHAGWTVEVLGEDAGRRSARALLSFPRTRWMSWPPDLAQVEELLRSPAARRLHPTRATPAAAGAAPTPLTRELPRLAALAEAAREAHARLGGDAPGSAGLAGDLERLARGARSLAWRAEPPPPAEVGVELGSLLEEQLAALTLRGKKGPRFLYRGTPGLSVRVGREPLVAALDAVLLTARGRAAPGDMIRVELLAESGARSGALVRVEFPAGEAASGDAAALLTSGGELGEPGPADLPAAQAVVEAAGGSLEFGPGAPGTFLAQLRLPLEARAAEEVDSAAQGVTAAAEDPFA
jgi:hypothetical protein